MLFQCTINPVLATKLKERIYSGSLFFLSLPTYPESFIRSLNRHFQLPLWEESILGLFFASTECRTIIVRINPGDFHI